MKAMKIRNFSQADFGALSGDATYTVERGDTLYVIAQQYYGDGSRWKEIADANNISDPRKIQPGDELTIPNVDDTDDGSTAMPPPQGSTGEKEISLPYLPPSQTIVTPSVPQSPVFMPQPTPQPIPYTQGPTLQPQPIPYSTPTYLPGSAPNYPTLDPVQQAQAAYVPVADPGLFDRAKDPVPTTDWTKTMMYVGGIMLAAVITIALLKAFSEGGSAQPAPAK